MIQSVMKVIDKIEIVGVFKKVSQTVWLLILTAIVGAVLGSLYLTSTRQSDNVLVGAFEGILIGGIVLLNFKAPSPYISLSNWFGRFSVGNEEEETVLHILFGTILGALVGAVLLGIIGAFVGVMGSSFIGRMAQTSLNFYEGGGIGASIGLVSGALFGAIIGFVASILWGTFVTFVKEKGSLHFVWLFMVQQRIRPFLTLFTGILDGIIVGVLIGFCVGAIGGGIVVWGALTLAWQGALFGVTVGLVTGALIGAILRLTGMTT